MWEQMADTIKYKEMYIVSYCMIMYINAAEIVRIITVTAFRDRPYVLRT